MVTAIAFSSNLGETCVYASGSPTRGIVLSTSPHRRVYWLKHVCLMSFDRGEALKISARQVRGLLGEADHQPVLRLV